MWSERPSPAAPRVSLRTPAHLIVLGAALAFGSIALDAVISLSSNLAFLGGQFGVLSLGLFLLDLAFVGVLIPLGLFLALCGIVLSVRLFRPGSRRSPFHIALGGAGLYLASGLTLGVLNLSAFLVPPGDVTATLLQTETIVVFVATLASGAGLLLALAGTAALIAGSPEAVERGTRRRAPRGKRIYEEVPSGR